MNNYRGLRTMQVMSILFLMIMILLLLSQFDGFIDQWFNAIMPF